MFTVLVWVSLPECCSNLIPRVLESMGTFKSFHGSTGEDYTCVFNFAAFPRKLFACGTVQGLNCRLRAIFDSDYICIIAIRYCSIMNSLEWRVKRLEARVLGQISGLPIITDQESILSRLHVIANYFRAYTDENGEQFQKFQEKYDKSKHVLSDSDVDLKQDLVLSRKNELIKSMQEDKYMAEKADQILDSQKWPDVNQFKDRLDKLQTITKQQYSESVKLDKRTEELIEVYNEILQECKINISTWNSRLQAYEEEDRNPDSDQST